MSSLWANDFGAEGSARAIGCDSADIGEVLETVLNGAVGKIIKIDERGGFAKCVSPSDPVLHIIGKIAAHAIIKEDVIKEALRLRVFERDTVIQLAKASKVLKI